MNIISYYKYDLSFEDQRLKLDIDVILRCGTDTIYYTFAKNIDMFFFIGNPTLIPFQYGVGIRNLLPPLKVIT